MTPYPPIATLNDTRTVETVIPAEFMGLNVNYQMRKVLHPGRTHVDLRTHVGITAVYGALESTDVSMMYKVVGPGEDRKTIAFREITKSFDLADGMVVGQDHAVRFTIPSTQLVGKEKGVVEVWLYSCSSSTGPNLFIGEPAFAFVDDPSNNTEGFAFM